MPKLTGMGFFDWNKAIEINRTALLGVLSVLFRLLARGQVDNTVFLSPASRRRLLRLLVPAEAATRRLIYICVHVMKITVRPAKKKAVAPPDFSTLETASDERRSAPRFKLVDPYKRIDWSAFDDQIDEETSAADTPKRNEECAEKQWEPVGCSDLLRRAQAMKTALTNLKGSARRMAREAAKRSNAPPGPKHLPPIRPGPPPGRRKRGREDVDQILKECHGLVADVKRWPP